MAIEIRIDELLAQQERTAYWLSKESGVGHTSIWKLRHRKNKNLNLDHLERICRALDCQPGDLIVLTESKPQSKRKAKGK